MRPDTLPFPIRRCKAKRKREPLTLHTPSQHTPAADAGARRLVMISPELPAQSLPWQIALFGLVGVANTVLDFVIYNLLTRKIPRIPANICSTSVAMAFSFTANFFVFQPHTFDAPGQATKFIIVTAVSLYVIQNVVIYLTTNVWMQPVRWANSATQKIQLASGWSEAFVSKNTVKLLATGCSLVWNFLWYRFYVYV